MNRREDGGVALVTRTGEGDWRKVRQVFDLPTLGTLAVGNGLLMAPGYRSLDGVTWLADGFLPDSGQTKVRVECCHDRFFYFEAERENTSATETQARVYVSKDGVNAQLITTAPAIHSALRGGDVAYGNGLFLLEAPAGGSRRSMARRGHRLRRGRPVSGHWALA
ncbi:MAG: hypothetical protein J6386_17245 [Candidatus Synoicihabitans palmerolidicus]|nr:hypothetical protein [Candidatus Synoicihabitans palmerolidicus]